MRRTAVSSGWAGVRRCVGVLLLALVVVFGLSCAEGSDPDSAGAGEDTDGSAVSASTTSPPAPVTATAPTTGSAAKEGPRDTAPPAELRRRAAGLLIVGFPGTEPTREFMEFLEETPPAGVILFERNVESPEQIRRLAAELRAAASADDLLIAVDQEGGPVTRIQGGTPALNSPRDVPGLLSPAEAQEQARLAGEFLAGAGVNVNLAPVADVVDDPGYFLYDRSFSGDPAVAADYVAAYVRGYEDAGIASVPKHFPGHGSAAGDTHLDRTVTDADESEFRERHFPPFVSGMEAGAPAVMMSHVIAKAYDASTPASLSPVLIEDVLRGDLGFSGVVVSDDLEMAAVEIPAEGSGLDGSSPAPEEVVDPAVGALAAGADLLIIGHTAERRDEAIAAIADALRDGVLSDERVGQARRRVAELARSYGIRP